MATTELLPNLHLLTPGGWQVYLWRDEDGVTLIDASAAGSGPELGAALAELGLGPADVDRLVLTHTACFGQGQPVIGDASAALAAASTNLTML